ncbi:MAG: zinc ribbon domain-containing protein [bacterium]
MADLFDKVKQSVGKGLTAASIRSKEMLETAKINREIGRFQEKRRNLLEKLGNIVYTMYLHSPTFDKERIKEMCEALTRLDDQVKDKKEELERTHLKAQEALGIVMCDCGAETYKDAKFCSKCGKKIEEIAETVKGGNYSASI